MNTIPSPTYNSPVEPYVAINEILKEEDRDRSSSLSKLFPTITSKEQHDPEKLKAINATLLSTISPDVYRYRELQSIYHDLCCGTPEKLDQTLTALERSKKFPSGFFPSQMLDVACYENHTEHVTVLLNHMSDQDKISLFFSAPFQKEIYAKTYGEVIHENVKEYFKRESKRKERLWGHDSIRLIINEIRRLEPSILANFDLGERITLFRTDI